MSAPVAGTTRYLCPLECGWHHDVPPPSIDRMAELGATADPATRDLIEAITSVAHGACLREAEQIEQALREHLDTHTTEQFVRTIQGLRAEVVRLRGKGLVRPDAEPAKRPVHADPLPRSVAEHCRPGRCLGLTCCSYECSQGRCPSLPTV